MSDCVATLKLRQLEGARLYFCQAKMYAVWRRDVYDASFGLSFLYLS